jgi:hypothetical protein
MIVQIPFMGFCESIHDNAINDYIDNQCFTDYETGMTNNDNLSQRLYDSLNWRDLFIDYAKEYAEHFAHEFKIKLNFESLSSPREYNFTTDRIFCEISESELKRLYDLTDKAIFKKTALDMFTSRDGFCSFYDNDISTWGALSEYDHNQYYCLLMAYLETIGAHDDYEWSIVENMSCDGFMSEAVYEHCSDKRIFNVFDYLQKRKAA